MLLEKSILPYQSQPIPHQVLLSLLKEYKRPNDKINEMARQGELVPLKRGWYIWNGDHRPENFTIANVLYGPSYVSAESALAFHGLIPEQVFSTVSMTTKPSKNFTNKLGTFEYRHLPTPYYAFGVEQEKLLENQFALIATGEKALFDKVVTTSGVLLRSRDTALNFMLENLRMDEAQLRDFDLKAMQLWIADAPKKESLSFIIKAIESL